MIKNKQIFNIRETVEIFVPDRQSQICYIAAFFLIATITVVITFLFGKIPNIVPLYFTLPWGEARLAPKIMLYLLPIIALSFLLLNLSFGRIFRKLSPLLPMVLAVSTIIVTCMITIALFGIIQSLIL